MVSYHSQDFVSAHLWPFHTEKIVYQTIIFFVNGLVSNFRLVDEIEDLLGNLTCHIMLYPVGSIFKINQSAGVLALTIHALGATAQVRSVTSGGASLPRCHTNRREQMITPTGFD